MKQKKLISSCCGVGVHLEDIIGTEGRAKNHMYYCDKCGNWTMPIEQYKKESDTPIMVAYEICPGCGYSVRLGEFCSRCNPKEMKP